MTISFEFREKTYELPAKFDVCSDCEGHGTHLHSAIREHAYSAEEFAESFDDEEAGEYFRRGGRYDVRCETCNGDRVERIVDEDSCTSLRHRRILKLYYAMLDERAAYAAECAAERRYGC